MNILSCLAVGEQFLGTKLFRPLERKIILKGKLASYSNEELLAFLGLLAISIGTNKYEHRHEGLLEYQRLVPEAQQFCGPVFTKDRLLMLHSMLHF